MGQLLDLVKTLQLDRPEHWLPGGSEFAGPVPPPTPDFVSTNETDAAGRPVVAGARVPTIGPARVGDRYVPPSWGEIMTSANPLRGIAEHVIGAARPASVAAQDPYGILAWEKGAGPLPGFLGTTEEVGAEIASRFPRFTNAIKAYHGSPHDFEKFSLAKIGTGEGAQAYGHGLYFAEQEGTAKAYRDVLKGQSIEYKGKTYGFAEAMADPELRAAKALTDAGGDIEKAAADLHGVMLSATTKQKQDFVYEAIKRLKTMTPQDAKLAAGRMYEVNIQADPAHFLDWDAPLKEQPDAHAKIRALVPEWGLKDFDYNVEHGISGGNAYHNWVPGTVEREGKAATSQALQQAGIPGIKYLDQGSRTISGGELIDVVKGPEGWQSKIRVHRGGDTHFTTSAPHPTREAAEAWAQQKIANSGTRNFVVFDDALIDILKKYGLSAATIGLLHRALTDRSEHEQ